MKAKRPADGFIRRALGLLVTLFRKVTGQLLRPWDWLLRKDRLTAVHEAIHHGASSDSNRTMNAAHAFTGCKKTGDRLIRFNVENGCLNVDGDAAMQ